MRPEGPKVGGIGMHDLGPSPLTAGRAATAPVRLLARLGAVLSALAHAPPTPSPLTPHLAQLSASRARAIPPLNPYTFAGPSTSPPPRTHTPDAPLPPRPPAPRAATAPARLLARLDAVLSALAHCAGRECSTPVGAAPLTLTSECRGMSQPRAPLAPATTPAQRQRQRPPCIQQHIL